MHIEMLITHSAYFVFSMHSQYIRTGYYFIGADWNAKCTIRIGNLGQAWASHSPTRCVACLCARPETRNFNLCVQLARFQPIATAATVAAETPEQREVRQAAREQATTPWTLAYSAADASLTQFQTPLGTFASAPSWRAWSHIAWASSDTIVPRGQCSFV